MSEQILINVTPQETRVAVLEQGVVQEIHLERTAGRGIVGNIYLGIVARVLPGMQSAFIDLGLARTAFLHIADMIEQRLQPSEPQRIERLLFEGQRIMVQVLKDPINTKGARVATQISVAGRFLVFLPQETLIAMSQRIEQGEEREQLRERFMGLLPQLSEEEQQGGYIMRTSAEHASDEELLKDITYLNRVWADILHKANVQPPQSVLYQELNLPLRILRDTVRANTEQVMIDSLNTFQKVREFALDFVNEAVPLIAHYTGDRPLFELHGVEEEIEKAMSRRVNLKFGGYLIFDQTEAMTTIDVNTGGFVGSRSLGDTVFKTNLEAAQVIARQLRLRNLGGIIIVDFIDMESLEHRDQVLQELQKALERDRTKVTISGFTSLNLVEITRKRTRESLAHIFCEPCPTCQGRGEIKTAQTVCYEVLRDILRESRQFNIKAFRVLASQAVIDMFLDEESASLAQLADFIGKPISLEVESVYTQEQFDVILV